MTGGRFDAVLFDAGGVLVLPDPTVLAPLLVPYGASTDLARHRRAHYAAMAAKSRARSDEHDWEVYDAAYVDSLGVAPGKADLAALVLGRTVSSHLWRWPIPETGVALRRLAELGIPLGVVSNASGQIEQVLADAGVCQVGAGTGVAVRVIIDSEVVGIAKPDPAIFEFALVHFGGIERHRIAYIGDSVTMDVAAAGTAGLHPILLDPYDDHEGAAFERVRDVAEIIAAVV